MEAQLYEQRYCDLIQGIDAIVWEREIGSERFTFVSQQAEKILGYPLKQWYEQPNFWVERIYPQTERDRILALYQDVIFIGKQQNIEFAILAADGRVVWLQDKISIRRNSQGDIEKVCGLMVDVTEYKQNEQSLKFLFEASNVLSSSLDYKTTLKSVVHLAVPEVADWCAIDILEANGEIKRLAVAHVDPAKVDLAYELYRRYPPEINSNEPAMQALRTGESLLINEIPDSLLVENTQDLEHLRIIRALNLKSAICVPLVARGRSLGIITFVTAESGKRYQQQDLTLAEELARRAALALDNARLYQEAQEAQRSQDETLALLDTLLVSAPIGIAFFDRNYRCVRINNFLAAMNGVSIEESIGRTVREYLPDFADTIEPILQQVFQRGEPILDISLSGDNPRTGISNQHVLASYYPVYSKNRQILGIGLTLADITNLKRTEETLRRQAEALQQQQQWLETVLNMMPTPLLFIEPGTARVTFANRAADELAGGEFPKNQPAEEYHTVYYCTDTNGDRLSDEQMPGVRVARGETLSAFEMNWHTLQGIRSLLIYADTIPAMHGHPDMGVVNFQDVTKLKQIEKALQKGNDRLKLLSETANDLLSSQQPIALVNSLFKKLSVLLDLEVYFNYLIDDNNPLMRLMSYSGISEQLAQQFEWLEFGQAVCGLVAQERRQIALADVQKLTDPRTQILRSLGITAYASQPIMSQGRLFGTLSFGSRTRSSFSLEEIALMQTLCDQIAIALERADLISNLQQQTAQLQEANRLKDEFLAVVSHELRSPLNAILGWATILRSGKLDATKTARALETIERNAKAQTELIGDLLDVSRIITGKLRLNISSINLVPVIEAAIDSTRLAADAKGITLHSELEPIIGQVSGDANRLQQVFWNLLANAIKFTPNGGCIQIKTRSDRSSIEIEVSDTGIGISPQFLPYVFERFRQADATTTRAYGGLGLGLAIVRHLVEMHGGTVSAASLGEGCGATFTVKLPLLKAETRRQKAEVFSLSDKANSAVDESSLISSASLEGLQVLVVDDEPDTREVIIAALQSYGAQVKAVASVKEALDAIATSKPDILISDISMPIEDGYSLIRQVRSFSELQGGQIPAVALTAYARSEDRLKALQAGFQVHLSKPLDPTELFTVVASLTRRS